MAKSPRKPPDKTRLKRGAASRDYTIGRGRPPIEHQWKPNQSGNKKGRPKGSKNLKTIIRNAVRKGFKVTKGGRPRKLTTHEVGIHNLQQEIFAGSSKAFLLWLEIVDRYGPRDDGAPSMQELLAEDHAILKNLLARKASKPADEGEPE